MKTHRFARLLAALAFVSLAFPANAADRMRAGQWSGTTTTGGRTFNTSNCITQGNADAMNGDANSIRTYLEAVIPPAICRLTNIRAIGGQVSYASTCRVGAATVVTTTYHGDSFESVDTKGTKSSGKRIGACRA